VFLIKKKKKVSKNIQQETISTDIIHHRVSLLRRFFSFFNHTN